MAATTYDAARTEAEAGSILLARNDIPLLPSIDQYRTPRPTTLSGVPGTT